MSCFSDLTRRILPLVFGTLFGTTHAFETEDERVFPVDNARQTLTIISTADTSLFAPLILAFQQKSPNTAIKYISASSTQLMQAVFIENIPFDIAISSAMDLQTKELENNKLPK